MKFSFYHVTDTHYFSKKNYDSDPWKLPVYNNQLMMRESEELLKECLDVIKKDKDTDTVFFTGDMTNRGDIDSLNETYELLTGADKKLNVYSFLDTHDYFSDESVIRVNENGELYYKVIDNKEEKDRVRERFSEFGTKKAEYVYKDNFTCFIEVKKNIYYVQIENHEDENGKRVINEDVLSWVENKAAELKKQGAFIFAGIHIPVLTPSPVYIILGNGSVPVNSREIARRLADAGVSFILSGHTHMHKIRHMTSEKGNTVYEIGTGSLGGYPAKIRKITVDTDKNTLKIRSISINPKGLFGEMSAEEYSEKAFRGSLTPVFYNMEHDVEKFVHIDGGVKLPEEAILKHKKLVMKTGKMLNEMTFGKAGDFIRHETGLKKSDYESIRDKKLIPALLETITDLYSGKPGYNPYTPEYKVLMSYGAAIDSILRVIKIDMNKILGYEDVYSVAEPLFYKGENDNADIDLNKTPEKYTLPYKLKAHTGAKIIGAAAAPIAGIMIFTVVKIINKLK